MVDINNTNNDDNDNDNDAGNNKRGIIVRVNPYFVVRTPYFVARTFAKEAHSKVVLRHSFATIRFFKWKLNNEGKKLKIRNEEKNATIRHYDWRLPKVEDDLLDARRSLQDEKQSNEEKDGRIVLITDQKKQQIRTLKRLHKKAKDLNDRLTVAEQTIVEANRRELGLKEQNSLRVRVLEEEVETSNEEAETRVRNLKGEVNILKEEAQTHVERFKEEVKLKEEAETCVRNLKGEVNI
jgi:hypothetical protein